MSEPRKTGEFAGTSIFEDADLPPRTGHYKEVWNEARERFEIVQTPTARHDAIIGLVEELRERAREVEMLHQRVPEDSPFNAEGRDVCGTCMDGQHPADWPCRTIRALRGEA